MNKEEMVLVVCRTNINASLLQPLQLIIPTLRMAAPFSLYTSDGLRIFTGDLYTALTDALNSASNPSLSHTLRLILKQRQRDNFRVCILGGVQVNWDIVLEYKRRKILIDTAGMSEILSQVSHTTGGISKIITPLNIIKTFLTDFSMSTATRRYYLLQENSPICCKQRPLSSEFYACSVCMNIFCPQHAPEARSCGKCGYQFDASFKNEVEKNLEITLKNEEKDKDKKMAGQDKNIEIT